MRALILSFLTVFLLSLAAATMLGPKQLLEALLHSPQGLVLLGRVSMVYQVVYPTTHNHILTAFLAIVLNNASAMSAVSAAPPVIHAVYSMKVGRRRVGWSFYRAGLRFIASFYVAMLALPLGALLLTKPALFMVFEAIHIFLTAYTVYASADSDETFRETYSRNLAKYLPVAALFMVFAAAMEAFEASLL